MSATNELIYNGSDGWWWVLGKYPSHVMRPRVSIKYTMRARHVGKRKTRHDPSLVTP